MLRTTIELLLKGEFICPFVTPKAYQFLSDPDDRKQVEDILQAMGRKVSQTDRKSTRLNSSHIPLSRMPSSA